MRLFGVLLAAACSYPHVAFTAEPILLAAVPRLTPDASRLVFEWGGDIWMASSEGGDAHRIVAHPAEDAWPCLSPDGTMVAFQSNRDGSRQLYVQPIAGGIARQITFHSEGILAHEWSPDGATLLAVATRDHGGLSSRRIMLVDISGIKNDEVLFDDYGDNPTFSPDGRRVLFTREGAGLYRKGYVGSMASQIWLYDRDAKSFRLLLRRETECRSPMWMPDGSGFYYVGAQTGTNNLWSYHLETGEEKQLTFYQNDGPILPSISRDGQAIVYRVGFDFELFHPGSNREASRLSLNAPFFDPGPLSIPRKTVKTWNIHEWGTLAWSKARDEMLFTAGGAAWVMDTKLKEPLAIHEDPAAHVSEAVFSPENDAVFYLLDEGDRINVWKAVKTDPGQPWWRQTGFVRQKMTDDDISRKQLGITPNGKWLSWVEYNRTLTIWNVESGTRRDLMEGMDFRSVTWAPHGRWIAATVEDSHDNWDVWLIDAEKELTPINVSRHPDWDGAPAWSHDSRKLAFIGQRGTSRDLDLFYVILDPEEAQRGDRDRRLSEALPAPKKISEPMGAPKPSEMDISRLHSRIYRLERPNTRDADPFWNSDNKRLAFISNSGGKNAAHYVDVTDANRTVKSLTAFEGYKAEWVGERIYWHVDGQPSMFEKGNNTVYPVEVYTTIELPAYRRLAFLMMWRTLRDEFYDGTFRGQDWTEIKNKYVDMAEKAIDWSVYRRVIHMMNGELMASHTGFSLNEKRWPDWAPPREWTPVTGHPGFMMEPSADQSGWVVTRVITGGPADHTESRIRVGERVLSIDKHLLDTTSRPERWFTGRPGKAYRLRVASHDGEERQVEIVPTTHSSIRELVWSDWIEQNRSRVASLSNNRLAYLHVDRMQWEELARFEQEVFGLTYDKEGLVIDVRNNRGGFTADRMLQMLNRPLHALTIPRGGDVSYPRGYLVYYGYDAPIVVLCNQNTASNGEIFSHAIKTLGRGKLVGVPTGGAVISKPVRNILDVGELSIPARGWWTMSERRDMEHAGAVPDVVIWPEPGEIPAGRDAQLEKAVEILLGEVNTVASQRVEPLQPWTPEKATASAPEPELTPPAAPEISQPTSSPPVE